MIANIVRYLHDAGTPFRLASYPSAEAEPKAAHRLPAGGMLVDTALLELDGQVVLTCFPAGEMPDLAAVGTTLGGIATAARASELPPELRDASGPVPPFGRLFGLPLVVDERVQTGCAVIVFRAFRDSDWFDIPYDDFALLEQPRIASFASAGELSQAEARASQ